MRYLKKFNESSTSKDMMDKIDDISAYLEQYTRTSIASQWCLPNFDTKRILNDKEYLKYNKSDKKFYVKYYVIGFYKLSSIFKCETDIRRRAEIYDLKFFILNNQTGDKVCRIILFDKKDWEKLDTESISKNLLKSSNGEVLFEDDIKIEKEEFDIIYEDDEIMSIKPKSYRAAIRYSSDSSWKIAFKKNLDWIEKYISRGSYYGGYNWYKTKNIKKEVNSWWRKILKLKPTQSEEEVKEFISDFPKYLLYIVIFKKLPVEDNYSKLYLLYDVSRSEYGQLPRSFSSDYVISGDYWGENLDAGHNQLKISNTSGKMVTLKDIQKEHGPLFNRAFREIESDFTSEKDKLYDLLGFWSDKGGEYKNDALVFLRSSSDPSRLQITRPSLINRDEDNGTIRWTRLGYYDDPNFDWWELDKEKTKDKLAPNYGYKDYFQSISDDVKMLTKSLNDKIKEDNYKL